MLAPSEQHCQSLGWPDYLGSLSGKLQHHTCLQSRVIAHSIAAAPCPGLTPSFQLSSHESRAAAAWCLAATKCMNWVQKISEAKQSSVWGPAGICIQNGLKTTPSLQAMHRGSHSASDRESMLQLPCGCCTEARHPPLPGMRCTEAHTILGLAGKAQRPTNCSWPGGHCTR